MVALNTARILIFAIILYMVAFADNELIPWRQAMKLITNSNANTIIPPFPFVLIAGILEQGTTYFMSKRLLYILVDWQNNARKEASLNQMTSIPAQIEGNGVDWYWGTRIFANESVQPSVDYFNNITTYPNTDFMNSNFTDVEQTADFINWYMDQMSNGRCKKIVKSNYVSSSDAIITSMVHFKGKLKMEYIKTVSKTFWKSKTVQVKCNFWEFYGIFNYLDDDTLNAFFVSIPFVDTNYTMLLVIPHGNMSIIDFTLYLKRRVFNNVKVDKVMPKCKLSLPTFKFNVTMNFKETFISILRGKILVNLWGSDSPAKKTNAYQNVILDVGGEVMESESMRHHNVLECNVNRPFMYFIRYKEKTLLAGQIVDPSIM